MPNPALRPRVRLGLGAVLAVLATTLLAGPVACAPPAWTSVSKVSVASQPLAVGFHVWWDDTSRVSLAANIDKLDVVSADWILLKGSAGEFDIMPDPEALAIIAQAKTPPSVMPGILNARNGAFNGPQADRLLADPAARKAMIAALVREATARGYAGYIFDFEDLSPEGLAAYPGFLAEARAALQPLGREVWVSGMFANPAWPVKRMQEVTDAVLLMAYDQHWSTGQPGPVSAQDWFQTNLARQMAQLDPAKTIVGLANYGYDWTVSAPGVAAGPAAVVTFDQTSQIARETGAIPDIDPVLLNPTFKYQDKDGKPHELWFTDATTILNQIKAADPYRPRGYAMWRLGGEDPLIWAHFRSRYGTRSPR